MPQIGDLLRFKKELFFEGAVQADWFYDNEKRETAAKSFVFHGPEYFGVTNEDVSLSSHNLMDTCSFTDLIAQKLYNSQDGNSIIMAIAGYGTGKSHLAVTLGSLFSQTSKSILGKRIIKNITDADAEIGKRLGKQVDKPNFIITLNGMKDFNLNYEMLNSIKRTLREYKISDDIIRDVTKPYEIAKYFIQNNFENMMDSFTELANDRGILVTGIELKIYLEKNLESDPLIFEIVNGVYKQVTGGSIRWDDSLDIGRILTKLQDNLCGDRNPFHKILIMFDEFGRFIEYTAAFPARAGDSALQQIFEAIQNVDNNIIFVGFIQSDLKTYMARVERNSNIARYVGRFESSEKIYLSSNLETIFANLIERKDSQAFKQFISSRLNNQNSVNDYTVLHQDMKSWLPTMQYRGVWKEWSNFSKVILEGIYPLHPITTWILSNISNWLQQRSALVFVNSIFEQFSYQSIKEFGSIPTVIAISIIQSDFFHELLRAEEDGRQQSEYCILYNQIMRRYQDKLTSEMLDILAANVILRIGRFRTKTKNEIVRAFSYCTNHNKQVIEDVLRQLEEEYGVLSYDENAGCYDFIADATGARDFRRFIQRKRLATKIDLSLAFQGEVQNIIKLDAIDTSFSNEKHIRTSEWQYEQSIKILDDLSLDALKLLKQEWQKSTSPEKAKGKVVWVYVPVDTPLTKLTAFQQKMEKTKLNKTPLIFMLLDDKENRLYEAINDHFLALTLSEEEQARYAKFYPEFKQKTMWAIETNFTELASERLNITENRIEQSKVKLRNLCTKKFNDIYPKIVSFPFEGFNNKRTHTAKKILANISKNLLCGFMNYQTIQSQSQEFRNRVDAMFVTERPGSWGILDDRCDFLYPENESVRVIFQELDDWVETTDTLVVKDIFDNYFNPPYGLNEFSLGLLLACYINSKKTRLKIKYDGKVMKTLDWATLVYNDKGIVFKVLEQTELFVIEEDEYITRFLDVCSKIERTDDLVKALELQKELQRLKEEEDVPEILLDKVRGCEIILEEQDRLAKKVNDDLDENYRLLNRAESEFNLSHAIRALSNTAKKVGAIENSQRFKYTGQIKEEFCELTSRARKLIEDKFENWITTVKCDSPSQVSSFENWFKKVIVSLDEVGYAQYARICRSRLDNILSDLKRIELLKTIKERVSYFLKICKPIEQTTYDQLLNWSKDGQELINELNNHPRLKSEEVIDYVGKLRNKIAEVEIIYKNLKQDIANVFDKVFELTNIEDCTKLLRDIKMLVRRQIKDVDRDGIEEIGNYLQDFITEIENIDFAKMNRHELLNEANRLKDKWIGEDAPAVLDDVIKTIIGEKEQIYNILDEQWNKKYLKVNLERVSEWTTEKCMRWLEDVKLLPIYLSDSSFSKYKTFKETVEMRLEQNSIGAVVQMFLNLTEEQQQICFNQIQKYISSENII